MGKTSASKIKAARIPKHIAEIGMTPEQYSELKVYVKSIVLPGTPGFGGKRFSSKDMYRQWLNNALEEIGPRFFPRGRKMLVWPADYNRIYGAVSQVIQTMSYKIKRDHKKNMMMAEGLRANGEEKDRDEMGVAGDEGCGGKVDDDDADVGENPTMVDEESVQEQKQGMEVIVMDQNGQKEEAMEDEMWAEPIELEDLLDLMKPEVFAEFPDVADEHFDWVGITDSTRPEPSVRLLLLIA